MILLLSDDLLDASKTIASARAVGIAVRQVRTVQALLEQALQNSPPCCIVDLQCPGLDIAGLVAELSCDGKKIRLVAYGSHVDTARLRTARQSGYDEVMPRSEFFESMPIQIGEWAKSQ
jgi:FixJ family two-component response regulator